MSRATQAELLGLSPHPHAPQYSLTIRHRWPVIFGESVMDEGDPAQLGGMPNVGRDPFHRRIITVVCAIVVQGLPNTADTPNRLRDRAGIEASLRCTGKGMMPQPLLTPRTQSLLSAKAIRGSFMGGLGSYIELTENQIRWAAFPVTEKKGSRAYYHAHYTQANIFWAYAQVDTVSQLWSLRPPPREGLLLVILTS